jgi:hypothetical protein
MLRELIFAVLLLLTACGALAQGTPAPPPKPDADSTLGTVASGGLNQNVVAASDLSNNELLARSRTIAVASETVFVKKEDMEKYLLRQKELEDFKLHVVKSQQDADLILHIKRIAFTNNFPYSITDRVSGIVLMQGEIDAFPSKVPPQIASALAEKLKEANRKNTGNRP